MDNALLDALGYVGDALDKPGRAVRGLLGGRPEEAAAIVPFSDAMGLTDHANRVGGSDLLRQLGMDPGEGIGGTLAGMGVEMATDPLMFAGGALGGLLGRRAGAAAMARGPRYETTADDLARMVGRDADELTRAAPQTTERLSSPGTIELQDLEGVNSPLLMQRAPEDLSAAEFQIAKILGSPSRDQLLREINPASKVLGAGAEGVAFQAPGANVLRVGQLPKAEAGVGRLIDPDIVQATRAVDYPGPLFQADPTVMRAERTPFAAGVGDRSMLTDEAVESLRDRLSGRGIDWWDDHIGNAGMFGNRARVIDPGSVMLDPGRSMATQAVASGTQEPSALMRALIALGDGTAATRRAIDAGDDALSLAYPLARVGGMGGAGLGAAGRTLEGF